MNQSLGARGHALALLGIAIVASACSDSVEPVIVASIEVVSPIGTLLDVGGTTQLGATARSPAGEVVNGLSFTWTSSNPAVATTGAAGLTEARGVGTTTIRADAGGVAGTLAIRVVDADVPAILALARDPLTGALVGALSPTVRAPVGAAVDGCTTGAGRGQLTAIQDCVAAVEAETMAATDPTDRALLAVLGLLLSRIERLLNL